MWCLALPRIKVILLAVFREVAGWREKEVCVEDNVTVGELVNKILRDNPKLREVVEELKQKGFDYIVLVNGRHVEYLENQWNYRLREGDRVAILPPAGGG